MDKINKIKVYSDNIMDWLLVKIPKAELYQWIFSPLNIINYLFMYFYFKDQAHYGDTYLTYSMWWREFDIFIYEEVVLISRAIMN